MSSINPIFADNNQSVYNLFGGQYGRHYLKYRIEPRCRDAAYDEALAFRINDPAWLLARQLQFGRFDGNDAGSAIVAKVSIVREKAVRFGLPEEIKKGAASEGEDVPMEYTIEKLEHPITLYERIESGLYLKKLLRSACPSEWGSVVKGLLGGFPLPDPSLSDDGSLEALKTVMNEDLLKMFRVYNGKIFDGHSVWTALCGGKSSAALNAVPKEIRERYKTWFEKKYNVGAQAASCAWNAESLSYHAGIRTQDNGYFQTDQYDSGRLSWYSYDKAGTKDCKGEKKLFSYLPTIAMIPGAPSRSLWEIEERNVRFGNITGSEVNSLANSVVMQFMSLYGNDWFMTPLEAVAGTVFSVDGILVKDTFGEYTYIDKSANEIEAGAPDSYVDRWGLFVNSLFDRTACDYDKSMLYPPTALRIEESKPLEEVQFLRDEMANMLWGVETVVNDQCGGTVSGNDISERVYERVDSLRTGEVHPEEDIDYSFLLMNRVPMNWIPFPPEHLKGNLRTIHFTRGRMPVYYPAHEAGGKTVEGRYDFALPSTSILKENTSGKRRYIDGNVILGYGQKVVTTAQRTRWHLGASFTWIGRKKVTSEYQANSGLLFDDLLYPETGKAITLKPKGREE